MPTLLGVSAATYLLSSCLVSSASEGLSWIAQAVAVGVGITWFCVGVIVQGQRIRWCSPVTFYVCYFCWGLTGIAVTTNPEYFLRIVQTYAKVVLITWVILQSTKTRKDVLVCCLAIAVAGAIVAATGRSQIARALAYREGQAHQAEARASLSLVGQANSLGMFGTLVVMCGGFCIICYRGIILRSICVVCIIAGLYLVAASGSRTAMLGIAGAAVSVYLFHFRTIGKGSIGKKIVVSVVALGLIAAAGLFISKLPFFFRLVESLSSVHAIMEEPRIQYFFKAVGVMLGDPLFGIGWGGFALEGLGRGATGAGHYSHSTVAETMSATGLPGFLLYFGGMFALWKLIRNVRKLDLPKQDQATTNIIMSFFWVLFVWHAVAVMDDHRLIWPMLGAFCGYLWNLQRLYTPSGRIQAMR